MSILYKYKKGGILYKFQEGGTVTDPTYNNLLASVVKKKGGETANYEDLMNNIAFHESKYIVKENGKNKYKYMDTAAKQVGGGPGRGMFMFEEGDGKGGIIAVNRTYNYMKKEGIAIPKWLKDVYKQKSLDASKLTEEQQKTLFLGNYLEHPKANLGEVVNGEMEIVDFWGAYHQTENDEKKKENFKKDMEIYSKTYRQ